MGRNNADFKEESDKPKADMPGFEGTMSAFDSLMKSGKAIVDKKKSNE